MKVSVKTTSNTTLLSTLVVLERTQHINGITQNKIVYLPDRDLKRGGLHYRACPGALCTSSGPNIWKWYVRLCLVERSRTFESSPEIQSPVHLVRLIVVALLHGILQLLEDPRDTAYAILRGHSLSYYELSDWFASETSQQNWWQHRTNTHVALKFGFSIQIAKIGQ